MSTYKIKNRSVLPTTTDALFPFPNKFFFEKKKKKKEGGVVEGHHNKEDRKALSTLPHVLEFPQHPSATRQSHFMSNHLPIM